jgi:membrane protein YdbS with pleckstrin-like domain
MPEIYKAKPKKREVRNQSTFATRQAAQSSKLKARHGMGPRFVTVAERLHKHRKRGRIQTFSVMPGRVRFETQEQREKVILLLRQHWLTQVKWLVLAVLMVWAPLSLLWIPFIDFLPGSYQFMVIVIWYLLLIAFIYEKFISWFYHVFIITDERVIDIDFYHLLYKEISGTKIDNIEDVTFTQGGMMRAMFNFGNVSIQTAAEKREFTIESVPEPNRVVKILNELKLEEEHEKIIGKVR